MNLDEKVEKLDRKFFRLEVYGGAVTLFIGLTTAIFGVKIYDLPRNAADIAADVAKNTATKTAASVAEDIAKKEAQQVVNESLPKNVVEEIKTARDSAKTSAVNASNYAKEAEVGASKINKLLADGPLGRLSAIEASQLQVIRTRYNIRFTTNAALATDSDQDAFAKSVRATADCYGKLRSFLISPPSGDVKDYHTNIDKQNFYFLDIDGRTMQTNLENIVAFSYVPEQPASFFERFQGTFVIEMDDQKTPRLAYRGGFRNHGPKPPDTEDNFVDIYIVLRVTPKTK